MHLYSFQTLYIVTISEVLLASIRSYVDANKICIIYCYIYLKNVKMVK